MIRDAATQKIANHRDLKALVLVVLGGATGFGFARLESLEPVELLKSLLPKLL